MKKIIFLAVIATIFSISSFSQTQPVMDTPVRTTVPCPDRSVGIVSPVHKIQQKPRTVYVTPSRPNVDVTVTNSGNTTTNNYYYPANNPVPAVKENRPYEYRYMDNDSWLVPFLILLIIGGLIAALIYSNRHHNNPPAGSTTPVNITNNIPPAPKPVVVVPPSETEINNALEKAEKGYGTFWRESNGGYRVDFPKPKEEKKQEEKKD